MIKKLKTLFDLIFDHYTVVNSILFKSGNVTIDTEEIILRWDFIDGNFIFDKRPLQGRFIDNEFISANEIYNGYNRIETSLIRVNDVIYPITSVVKVSPIRIPHKIKYSCSENTILVIDGKKIKAKDHPNWEEYIISPVMELTVTNFVDKL